MIGEYFLNLACIDESVYEKQIDVISIGNMGCCRALPSVKRVGEILKKCTEYNKKLRLYTPRVPQAQLTFMQNYIMELRELLHQDSMGLVINDIGLLLWMNNQGMKAKNLILGSTYSWSQMQNTLYDNIVRDEKDHIKEVYVQVNSNHDYRLEFYKSLNITEIELPNIKEVLDRVERIRDHGFAVSVIKDYVIAGFSRSCVQVKMSNLEAQNCNYQCNNIIELGMEQMWDAVTEAFPYFKEDGEINQYYSSLFVHGNMQYRRLQEDRVGQKEQLNPEKDTLILWPEMDKVGSLNE